MSALRKALIQSQLSDDLEQRCAEFLRELEQEAPALCEVICQADLAVSFIKSAAVSPYFSRMCLRYAPFVQQLIPLVVESQAGYGAKCHQLVTNDTSFAGDHYARLRLARHLGLIAVIWREFGISCPVETTLIDLSRLADSLIVDAVGLSRAMMEQNYGVPDDELGVIAMGKLGGRELNLSSDVDLIFLHTRKGEVSSERTTRAMEHQEYFTKQARQLVDLLTKMTADGQVYRVDTRLRPFGRSGKPCANLASLEHYLSLHGREWERYAYIKHRLVTSCDHQYRELEQILKPFVYRKYLDFGVFESLREMRGLIDLEITQSELADNIKRGRGGIRQLEFIVQTQQLVYAGKNPRLQTVSFYQALNELKESGLVKADQAEQMRLDYNFLRRIENGIQGINDQQSHVLPEDDLDRERLSTLMGTQNWFQLAENVERVRERVQNNFDQLTIASKQSNSSCAIQSSERAWQGAVSNQNKVEPDNADALLNLGAGGLRDRLDKLSQKRLDQLMPRVLDQVNRSPERDELAKRMVGLIEGIGRRSAYFSLLNENEHVLKRVVSICQLSPLLARQLAFSPMLLDTLVDPRGSSFELTEQGLRNRCKRAFAGLDVNDEELNLNALREFCQTAVFDVAVADLENQLPVMQVSDRLTLIAELILDQALRLVQSQMIRRHGQPMNVDGSAPAQFAVIGYGKLGGIELSYGSDLDLVFLYDDGGSGMSDGEAVISTDQYFAKMARRFIHYLTIPTVFGALYEVDMRLRPSGRSGLLVSRIEAFEKYQREKAWTWEHQALLRARGIIGPDELLNKFEAIRIAVAQAKPDRAKLKKDVCEMRLKMKVQLEKSTSTQFDLKQVDGGLVDIEFLVQFLLLLHANQQPQLVRYSDNIRQLESLSDIGVLGEEASDLKRIYLDYREWLHRRVLSQRDRLIANDQFVSQRETIMKLVEQHQLWQRSGVRSVG